MLAFSKTADSSQYTERGITLKKLIYENPLCTPEDVADFKLEGQAILSFETGRLRMKNALDMSLGQKSNFVFWCPETFPSDIEVCWDFYPVEEPGLCMCFFAAQGIQGEDLFDASLAQRDGQYECYFGGDINTFHIAYFRRRYASERNFHVCNLRKSKGSHIVAQGADPIPNVEDAAPPYHIKLRKCGGKIEFFINDLPILRYYDDGQTFGKRLREGKIGFRQMAPMVAEYSDLKVYSLA